MEIPDRYPVNIEDTDGKVRQALFHQQDPLWLYFLAEFML